jgi:hypothetical protein
MTPERDGQRVGNIDVPASTPWPLVVALGLALGCAGLITHASLSAVGVALGLIGGVGWFRDVFPEQRLEQVARRTDQPPAPAPVAPAEYPKRPVEGAGHRTRLPVEIQPYSAGMWGGALGGVAMAVVALAYGLIVQRSLWYPINLLSAVALPGMAQASVARLHAFDLAAFAIGIAVHGAISVLVGLLYAVILPMLPGRHVFWGGIIAPLLWTGFTWTVLGIVNPTMAGHVDWLWFVVSQIAFGLVAGFVVAQAHPLPTMQTWPLSARAGVEMRGPRPGRGQK